jgi:dTDP-4-dehydrorhamnose reductase
MELYNGRLLVTGAGGQLGRAVARVCPHAILLTRAELDVADQAAVYDAFRHHRPSVVIHAAAWTRVDDAEGDPLGAWRVNVGGTEAVARAAMALGAFLVYPSSDYVFSGMQCRPYHEGDSPGPRSAYGRTKLVGERVAATGRHLIVRTSRVYGEGRNFIATIVTAARRGEPIAVVDDQVALPTYAVDLSLGILGLLAAGAEGVFHLAGGGEQCSWADMAQESLSLAARLGLLPVAPPIRRVSTREYQARRSPLAVRPAFSTLDCAKAASLGIRLRPWREALADYLRAQPSLPRGA